MPPHRCNVPKQAFGACSSDNLYVTEMLSRSLFTTTAPTGILWPAVSDQIVGLHATIASCATAGVTPASPNDTTVKTVKSPLYSYHRFHHSAPPQECVNASSRSVPFHSIGHGAIPACKVCACCLLSYWCQRCHLTNSSRCDNEDRSESLREKPNARLVDDGKRSRSVRGRSSWPRAPVWSKRPPLSRFMTSARLQCCKPLTGLDLVREICESGCEQRREVPPSDRVGCASPREKRQGPPSLPGASLLLASSDSPRAPCVPRACPWVASHCSYDSRLPAAHRPVTALGTMVGHPSAASIRLGFQEPSADVIGEAKVGEPRVVP
jgi:hypothetical protein